MCMLKSVNGRTEASLCRHQSCEQTDLSAAWWGATRQRELHRQRQATHSLPIRCWDKALPTAFSSEPKGCLHGLFTLTVLQGLRHPHLSHCLCGLMEIIQTPASFTLEC